MADNDEYVAKLKSLQQYIPFLQNMMAELKAKGNREAQLNKIQSLHDIITDKRKKLKLDTLNRCEEVLTNIYIKVNPQLRNKTGTSNQVIKIPDSPRMTPASPSPPRNLATSSPVVIPTEKVKANVVDVAKASTSHNIYPKVDVYGSAYIGNSPKNKPHIISKAPDMSKPPISLDDLKNLEDDVQDKLITADLYNASIDELQNFRKKIELQIKIHQVSTAMSPTKSELSEINTTVRNSLNLGKRYDKSKSKEKDDSEKSSPERKTKTEKETDKEKEKTKVKSKVLKVSDETTLTSGDTFGSALSSIEEKIVETKKVKKTEKKRDSTEEKIKTDDKSREKSRDHHKKSSKDKDRDKHKDKGKNKDKDHKKDKKRSRSKERKERTSNTDSKADKTKSEDSLKPVTNAADPTPAASPTPATTAKPVGAEDVLRMVKESMAASEKKNASEPPPLTDKPKLSPTYKRLADKYNPKPKKTIPEPEVDAADKVLSDSIEQNMKISPVKAPALLECKPAAISEPIPPPASLVRLTMEPEKPKPSTSALPDILQKIFKTPQIADPRRQVETDIHPLLSSTAPSTHVPPLLSPPHKTSLLSTPSLYSNFNEPVLYQKPVHDFNSHRMEFDPPSTPRLEYDAPSPRVDFDRPTSRMEFDPSCGGYVQNHGPRYIPPLIENPMNQVRLPFNNPRTGYNSFHSNQCSQYNIQYNMYSQMDFYANSGYQNQMAQPMVNQEMVQFVPDHKAHFYPDYGRNRGPRSYREYREMKEREAKSIKEIETSQEIKDPRLSRDVRDPRVNRDVDTRDPRIARDKDRRMDDYKESRNKDTRSFIEEPKPNRYDSKFDKMYSRTNRDNSRPSPTPHSGSRGQEEDSFVSPLDSLYTNRDEKKIGKGYGVQNFRIPKKPKKEEPAKLNVKETESDDDHICDMNISDTESVSDKEIEESIESTKVEEPADEASTKGDIVEEPVPVEEFMSEYERQDLENAKKRSTQPVKDVKLQEDVKPNEDVKLNEDAEPKEEVPTKQAVEVEIEEASSSQDVETSVEVDSSKSELGVCDSSNKPVESCKPDEPSEQNILAHFFENLLKSKNKNDKKTALFSLIETFSDSFTDKELKKITKIIKTNDDEEEGDSEEEAAKTAAAESTEDAKTDNEIIPEQTQEEETPEVGSTTEETTKSKLRRIRRISSTTEEENLDTSIEEPSLVAEKEEEKQEKEETPEVQQEPPPPNVEPVLVSVGERIKSRKRNIQKPRKKLKSELDLLHEDIQEMFIRDGVLTASGKRMCRLLKSDPNALSNTTNTAPAEKSEAVKKLRKKPGSKSKLKINQEEMKTMKNVRVILSKIPEEIMNKTEESSTRVLRSRTRTRNTSYAENDNEDVAEPKSDPESESSESEVEEEEEEEEEEESKPTNDDTNLKTKVVKRKRGKGWASGVIKKKQKKKAPSKSGDSSPERPPSSAADNNTSLEADLDKLFVEPDKNYYMDITHKTKILCKLCDYKGQSLTGHYLREHPHSEVLCSRFSPTAALEAKKDFLENKHKYDAIVTKKISHRYNYSCRICGFAPTVPALFFYEHVTTHTGEYRHQCGLCTFYAANGKTLAHHFLNTHPNQERKAIRGAYLDIIVYGYMCGECNYVQLKEKNVEEHVNIYHLGEKPVIYKVSMSNILDPALLAEGTAVDEPSASKQSSKATDEVTPQKSKQKKATPQKAKASEPEEATPPIKVRKKPGPKSKTKPVEAEAIQTEEEAKTEPPRRKKPGPKSKTHPPEPQPTDEVSDVPKTPVPRKIGQKRGSLEKLISNEHGEDLDSIIALSSRGRAAKEKATAKLKSLAESNEGSPRKKQDTSSTRKEREHQEEEAEEPEPEKGDGSTTAPEDSSDIVPDHIEQQEIKLKEETRKPYPEKLQEPKELDLNVFTCKTDILQEESRKIEEERLKKMEELNKSIGSRPSKLDFVDKLCTRLNKEQAELGPKVTVKQEPREDPLETPMPLLEEQPALPPMPSLKETNPINSGNEVPVDSPGLNKKKMLDDVPIPQLNISFPQNKTNSLFSKTIEKLQGKVNEASQQQDPLDTSNELPEASDSSSMEAEVEQTISIGGLIKASRKHKTVIFSCHFENCCVTTKDKVVFQLHCKFSHREINKEESSLCDKCGIHITSTLDTNLLENIYDHLVFAHSDFFEDRVFVKPEGRVLRMRKLSGDKLSVKREPEQEDAVANEQPAPSEATLELSEDNPFPFKIVEVMSLAEAPEVPAALATKNTAEAQAVKPVVPPPPLTLISPKQQPLATTPSNQLVIKEARMTQVEMSRSRKAPKAMTKFIETPAELYKCPHYYCMFTSNFREFLERHLKAHKTDTEVMIPCVYCNTKTPWEHVPMHIDIRHAHCRYACSYCLYRAWLKEYVCLHQDQVHSGMEYMVIQLPQHKASKKFSVADFISDPKAVCEPFKCLCMGEDRLLHVKMFLFENEFEHHLLSLHKNNFIQCGYKGCTHRVQGSMMANHWSMLHGVSTYQCGYCKMSCKELVKMYYHFAQFHQSMQPDILIRVSDALPPAELGYTAEAFAKLTHIKSLPPNVLSLGKPKGLKAIKMFNLTATTPTTSAPVKPPETACSTSTMVSVLKSPSKTAAKPPELSTQKFMLTKAPSIKFIVASTSHNSGGNILLLNAPTSIGNVLLASQPSQSITSVAPVSKPSAETLTVASMVVPSPLKQIKLVPVTQVAGTSKVVQEITEPKPAEPESDPLAPVEHVDVSFNSIVQSPSVPEIHIEDPLCVEGSSRSNDSDSESPLFEDFNVGPDSPPEDPLSITPTINAIEDPLGDPLEIPTTVSKVTSEAGSLSRSNSMVSNSDDESSDGGGDVGDGDSNKEKVGLVGHQLLRCASCHLSFGSVVNFRLHIMGSTTCRKPGRQPFQCTHCDKLMNSANKLVQHIQCHSFLRFSCSLCNKKCAISRAMRMHMKWRHNISQIKLVPVDPSKTDLDKDSFIVRPVMALQPSLSKETAPEVFKPTLDESTFTPDKINTIPIRQIFPQNVKCGLCNYQTKVRVNIIRHLQMHQNDNSVPDTAPVNPVPCLEKNEKMFDKMTNLAASSFTERSGGSKVEKEKEDEKIPEFVPTHCRFVCCAQGCSYLCPEEGNLRHHLIALHSDETEFTCVHCKRKITPTDADSILKHFKLHSLHLYKCKYCSFVHNLKHKVERHVSDFHLDMPVKYVTVRNMESDSDPTSQTPSTNKYKPWRCCMCKYKCATEEDMRTHVSNKHDLDCRYKCTLCSYKSNEMDSFDGHFKDHHPDHEIDVIFVYRKLEEEQKEDSEVPFDTTPLWQRDRPRVRHIRGILFDESSPQPAKSPKKPTKLPPKVSTATSSQNLIDCIDAVATGAAETFKDPQSAEELSKKLSNTISDQDIKEIIDIMPTAAEINEVKKVTDSNDAVIVIDDEDDNQTSTKSAEKVKRRGVKRRAEGDSLEDDAKVAKIDDPIEDIDVSEFSRENLIKLFGDFGSPNKKQWKCPKCSQFKSKMVCDFIYHLYKEMKVYRYRCAVCGDQSITFKYMNHHVASHPTPPKDTITVLSPDHKLEAWIQVLLREQSLCMEDRHAPSVRTSTSFGARTAACLFCDEKFTSLSEASDHMLQHWITKPYACHYCENSFYTVFELKHHQKSDHADKELLLGPQSPTVSYALRNCEYDNRKKSLPDNFQLRNFKIDKENEVKIESPSSPIKIDSDDELVIVSKTDDSVPNDDEAFACKMCPAMDDSMAGILQHLNKQHNTNAHRYKILYKKDSESEVGLLGCNVCHEVMNEINLRRHFMERHKRKNYIYNPYAYKCGLCSAKTLLLGSLKTHFTRVHSGQGFSYSMVEGSDSPSPREKLRMFKCSLCLFVSKSYRIASIKNHLGDHLKPVRCNGCKKRFKSQTDAREHCNRVHEGKVDVSLVKEAVNSIDKHLKDIVNRSTMVNNVAKKSTSSRSRNIDTHYCDVSSYEEEDLKNIEVTIENDGNLQKMTAEELHSVMNIKPYVDMSNTGFKVKICGLNDSVI